MKALWWLAATGLLVSARSAQNAVPSLPGTSWAASFYYYHEDWVFLSADSVAVNSGQWGWSIPVDPSTLAQDSIHMYGPEVLHYRAEGPYVIVERFPLQEEDTLTWDGQYFVSNWEFTYGYVVLQPGGDLNCHMHAAAP